MPQRKSPFKEKPWQPDPKKWAKHLQKQPSEKSGQLPVPKEPTKGWMLFRWDNLEDVKQ